MRDYFPALTDMRFVLEHVLRAPEAWARAPALADCDRDTAWHVLDEAARFAREVLAPLNPIGDHQGCAWQAGEVTTPAGFTQAYRAFVDGGWPSLACDPTWGGQGLPHTLNAALFEMLCAANHAWSMYPGLLHGAYACLLTNADESLKQIYLPRIVSGEWLCTMCLTEPQAGSDLGLIRTQARAAADGSYRLYGTKIFVSGGEQDLTENIVHLVLARLPDAAPGPKGLSLFLAPKFLPDASNACGTRNAIVCDGIESKMGIRGSATCTMRLDDATAWMVGQPGQGLAAMFVMMNTARLHVALQGVGHADAAYQHARRYAHERHQGRQPGRAETAPLVAHAAIQHNLLKQRCAVEGARLLALEAAQAIDDADHHPDPAQRRQAHAVLALLTPVAKAWCTQTGFEVSSAALQVFGGHGYVKETGAEQPVRDSRISMIYEGTNEIQAIDLLARKIVADRGAVYGQLLDGIAHRCEQACGAAAPQAQLLATHVVAARAQLADILALAEHDALYPHRIADDFLASTALLLQGGLWLRTLEAVHAHPGLAPGFLKAKTLTACYFFDYELARRLYLDHRIRTARTPLAILETLETH